MRDTIEAIYENGVLRPLSKLSMHEGQRVRLLLESKPSKGLSADTSYDFSDLVGRLIWKGDALAEQKRMRDEWS